MKFRHQATGINMIPNVEMWKEVPGNVKVREALCQHFYNYYFLRLVFHLQLEKLEAKEATLNYKKKRKNSIILE